MIFLKLKEFRKKKKEEEEKIVKEWNSLKILRIYVKYIYFDFKFRWGYHPQLKISWQSDVKFIRRLQ